MTTKEATSATNKRAGKPVAGKQTPRKQTRGTATARSRATAYDPAAQLSKLSADPVERAIGPAARRGPLARGAVPAPDDAAMPEGFFAAYTGAALTEQDYANAAQVLACDVAAVKAVAEVESRGGGFDASQRPKILYERHVFARCSAPPGKFDAEHPDLSGLRKPYAPGTYGNAGQQYVKLALALRLDQEAALKAPSWGMFQILGENHKACGFASVRDYVNAMTVSEAEHLKAFVGFLRADARLLRAIRARDWPAFALVYNGKDYAKFQYDTKMAAAFAKHGGVA